MGTTLPAALENGAVLVVAQRAIDDVPPDRTVLVGDVLDAMIAMGANYRAGFSPLVLGVTGSVGKNHHQGVLLGGVFGLK